MTKNILVLALITNKNIPAQKALQLFINAVDTIPFEELSQNEKEATVERNKSFLKAAYHVRGLTLKHKRLRRNNFKCYQHAPSYIGDLMPPGTALTESFLELLPTNEVIRQQSGYLPIGKFCCFILFILLKYSASLQALELNAISDLIDG